MTTTILDSESANADKVLECLLSSNAKLHECARDAVAAAAALNRALDASTALGLTLVFDICCIANTRASERDGIRGKLFSIKLVSANFTVDILKSQTP